MDPEPPRFDEDYLREIQLDRLTRRVLAVSGWAIFPPRQEKLLSLECGRCEGWTLHSIEPGVWRCKACGLERVPPSREELRKLAQDLGL